MQSSTFWISLISFLLGTFVTNHNFVDMARYCKTVSQIKALTIESILYGTITAAILFFVLFIGRFLGRTLTRIADGVNGVKKEEPKTESKSIVTTEKDYLFYFFCFVVICVVSSLFYMKSHYEIVIR